jgi:hypothetical protein
MKSNPYRCLVVAITVAALAGVAAAHAQSGELLNQSDTFAMRIAMEKETLQVGQPPRVRLTIWNLTDLWIAMPGDQCAGQTPRVRIQGEHGEPPTTARERVDTGRQLPGDQPLDCTLNAGYPMLSPASTPADTATRTFLLEYLYDLREPGKYTVYIEVPCPEGWVRSNTVAFQIVAGEPPPTESSS